jgi:hypothetical protein
MRDPVNLTQTRWAEGDTQEMRRPLAGGGRHDLDTARAQARLPENWPHHVKTQLAELTNDGLEYDEYGVIVLRPSGNSAFRRHAARHSAVAR